MQQTQSYVNPAAAVPFFRSQWGLLTLLAIGGGLYYYQRQGGSISSLFSKVWDIGLSARDKIGQIAPSVSDATTGSYSTASAIQ